MLLEDTEAVGYIDDASILAVGPTAPHNCKMLKRVHRKAEDWAAKHDSQFAPPKYGLVHFTRDPAANPPAARYDFGLALLPIPRPPDGHQAPVGLSP